MDVVAVFRECPEGLLSRTSPVQLAFMITQTFNHLE